MIKNIVFDIGNVLIHFDWDGFLRRSGASEEEVAAVGKGAVMGPLWRQMDEGKTDQDVIEKLMMDSVGPKDAHWIPFMIQHYEGLCTVLPYTVPWLERLKAEGYHVYCLSNFSKAGFERCIPHFPFLKVADGYLISYEVKLMKPSAEIYKALCDKYSLIPSECVMIDDMQENIDGAKAAGFHGLQFKNFRTPEIYQKQLDDLLASSGKE